MKCLKKNFRLSEGYHKGHVISKENIAKVLLNYNNLVISKKTFPKELFRGYNAEFRNCHSGSYVMKNFCYYSKKKNHTILKNNIKSSSQRIFFLLKIYITLHQNFLAVGFNFSRLDR